MKNINLKEQELCFECIEHFDFAKTGTKITIKMGKPRIIILKITFCSINCFEIGMKNTKLHLTLQKFTEILKLEAWLQHPIKCTCEICNSENIP